MSNFVLSLIEANPLNGKNLAIIAVILFPYIVPKPNYHLYNFEIREPFICSQTRAPLEFRFNDSAKLQEHLPRTARMHVDILNWLAHRKNFW